ncbi:hypothetical protein HRW07_12760 [Streptomyces lunaelactis]|uniref:hypothetical protein n=1 Tax=Streptomyces lunaelactis TaxID=1535768 RepID=UPI001584D3D3|nr:hypothetical protein [Streptomyces lunaelactis]NUL04090.1 hypothetical protein [Streptomyces lunaelactis]
MPFSRECRRRLPATAAALLGLLFALLLCSTAQASPEPADSRAVGVVVADAGRAPGCGKGAPDQDRGAHPGTPPRGGTSYELLPALYDAHGASASRCQDGTTLDITPERGPPPLVPPSPVDLSILRV